MTFDDRSLKNSTIVIPLHLPLEYPCDYIDQTARILSKNNSVILFDYFHPYSWKQVLSIANLRNLLDSLLAMRRSKKTVYFRAPSVLPFARFKKINALNARFGYFILSLVLSIWNKKVIVWQFAPLIKSKFFKKQFFVYDCVDYVNSEDNRKGYLIEEEKLLRTSDLIAFNSARLFDNKKRANPITEGKSVVTVCGCDYRLFSPRKAKIAPELADINQRMVAFMGVFDHRLDAELLAHAVKNNKNKKFILIGPIRKSAPKSLNKIITAENVLYLGEKRKKELPSYLKKCHLGIIPYDTKNRNVKYANPMKAYEYLACGLPVVSTGILALKDMPKDIVYTTDDRAEFSRAIEKIAADWHRGKTALAKKIAKKNSWENKILLIEKAISKYGKTN
ncbi:MAG: glycosyltransferase [Patescibacteria group bacterium]